MNIRNTARLIVVDDRNRVLFFFVDDKRAVHPAHPDLIAFWLLPGGGLDPGETARDTAERELREETSIVDVEIGPCVWIHERILNTHGEDILFYEEIFLVRVDAPDVNMDALLPYETLTHLRLCWLTLEEIHASETRFLPLSLPEHIGAILAGNLPEKPIRLRS